jgi:hypothetical protein
MGLIILYKIDIRVWVGYSSTNRQTMPISKEKKENAQEFCDMMDKLMKCYYDNNTIEDFEAMEEMLHKKRITGYENNEYGDDVPIVEPSVFDFYHNQKNMNVLVRKKTDMVRCMICDCMVTKRGIDEHQETKKCREIRNTKKFQHAQTNLKTADKLTEEKWNGNTLAIEKVSYDGGVLNTASGLRRIIDVFRYTFQFERINGKPKCVFRKKPNWKIREIVAKNCKIAVRQMKQYHKMIVEEEKLKIRQDKKAIALHNKQERERKSIAFQEKKRQKELEKASEKK